MKRQKPKGMPVVAGIYSHFKGGVYQVVDVGIEADTLGVVVAYRKLYNNQHIGQTWFRSLESWAKPAPLPRTFWQKVADFFARRPALMVERFALVKA